MRPRALAIAVAAASCLGALAAGAHPAGPTGNGGATLPNGRRVTPAGDQVRVGGWPQAIARSPDGTHVVTANTGAGPQSISWIDTTTLIAQHIFPPYAKDTPPEDEFAAATVYAGLVFSADGTRLWVSGGSQSEILVFDITPAGPVQNRDATIVVPGDPLVGPLALSPDGKTIYTVDVSRHNENVYAIDLATRTARSVRMPGQRPFALTATADHLYVGAMYTGDVVAFDPGTLGEIARAHVGARPMAITRAGDQLLVADANTDHLLALDPGTLATEQSLDMAMLPGGFGSSPNAIAVDGDRAAVTLGGVNAVALLDRTSGTWKIDGLVPTGWTPEAVLLNGATTWVANARGEDAWMPYTTSQNLGPSAIAGWAGTVSHIPLPADLSASTTQVMRNNTQETQGAPSEILSPNGPIRHVVFILRENKTFDADLGDTPGGDPRFVLFPRANTPSLHAMADRFAVLTDFYANGEASDEGHEWAAGGYVTDVVDRLWPAHGISDTRIWSSADPINYPAAGYLFDSAERAGITWRNFGEFMRKKYRGGPYLDELADNRSTEYPGWDQAISDTKRVKIWKKEFDATPMPAFTFIWLPNDHGYAVDDRDNLTLQQQVADNDLATGQVVDVISHSPYWSSTAIFITEDDPQSAMDHIDGHRTVGMVVSPYAKKGVVDVHSDTIGMVRTMEMILGLSPINQFDANARVFSEAFTSTPDLSPFDALALGQGIAPSAAALARAQAMARAGDHSAPDQVSPKLQLDYTYLSVYGLTARDFLERIGVEKSGFPEDDDD